jgi:hypothetical protein
MGLWRGEVVRTTGGFDPALGGCTDWDLWLRSASVGEAVHVPNRLIVHHWHGTNASGGHDSRMAAWHDALRAKQRAGAYRPPNVPMGVGDPAPPLLADCGSGVWVGNRGACNHRGESFARVVHVHDEPRDPAGVCRAAHTGIGPTSLVVQYQDREPLATATPGLPTIAEFCKAPGPFLVHCSMGGCRGPTLAVLALVSRGVAFDEAKERVRSAVLTYNQGIDLADVPMGEIRAWATGDNRRQPATFAPARPGPGTHLHRMLRRFGYDVTPSCGCEDLIRKMDAGGTAWTLANLPAITAHLKAAASSRGRLSGLLARVGAERLVRRAIRASQDGKPSP